MPVFRLTPVADPDDSRWLDHRIWDETVVRAGTSALARVLAAELERDPAHPPVGNESQTFRSAFADEKLYRVSRLAADDAARYGGVAGEDRVLHARIRSGRG